MPAGFVKLRRDIREHVTQGRLSLEEYAVFTFVVMNARHQNGRWRGCALTLSKQIRKSERWCQRMLASLRTKGYVTGTPSRGRGQYWMTVEKYFEKASVVSPSGKEGVCGVTLSPKKASVVTPLQEVKQEKPKTMSPDYLYPDDDGTKCLCCGCEDHLTRDHVIPKSRGGRDRGNIQTLCVSCNSLKGQHTSIRDDDGKLRLLTLYGKPMALTMRELLLMKVSESEATCRVDFKRKFKSPPFKMGQVATIKDREIQCACGLWFPRLSLKFHQESCVAMTGTELAAKKSL
jgi:5-methylcytosine-specific restriction endonuclease McrA